VSRGRYIYRVVRSRGLGVGDGALPWQDPEAYRKASPFDGLGAVTTPTLIHVGGNDPRVPPVHARALYRALHQYLGVPSELVVYPGEPHSLTTYLRRKAKMEWDLAWFGHFLAPGGAAPADWLIGHPRISVEECNANGSFS
jgi:fermentation-respiration switch protein FrsA (DUF1100 family)